MRPVDLWEQKPGPNRGEAGSNWGTFIQALRLRKREDLNAEIEERFPLT